MAENKKFTLYVLAIFALFTVAIGIAGYFEIGLVSDDYLNINGSINSTFADKLTGNLPFTNTYHLRTTYYLSLQSSNNLNKLLGFSYDNFLLFRIQNLLLYLFLAFAAGWTLLYVTQHLSVSILTSLSIIIFPNNINNICWTAGRVDLLCGIFYILALYFALKCVKEQDLTAFISCILSYLAALFTKETAITIPLITGILIYAFYGRDQLKKSRIIIITQLSILAVYVLYKIVFLGNNFADMITLYQSSPLSNAPGILARAAIALTVPLDFVTLNFSLRQKDTFLMVYLACLYGSLFYIISVMVKNEIYKYIGYMSLSAAVLLLPNLYIGYLRTMIILIPFIIIAMLLFWAYDHQLKNSVHINKILLKVFFSIALVFWSYWSISSVADWNYAFGKSKENIQQLLDTKIDDGKHTIVIGYPGRYKQTYLFDKLTGAYNYWKNRDFVIKDTINDIVQMGSIDKNSLNAKLNYKEISPGEFEINTSAVGQYFYMEGFDNEKIRKGFKNRDISVRFDNFNELSKPTKVYLSILNTSVKCFLCSELKYIKIY